MEIANDQQGVTAGGAAAISAPSEDLQGAAVPVAVAGERPEMENAEEAQGVASGENTTWPVDGEFGLDVLIEPVDSRLVLNYPSVPLPQPYWLTALFAEKKFSASCPQRCHAMGPDLPARLTLRNITRGDTAFGRVVVHEKLNTQFWIAGCVVKPRGARAGSVLWVYGPWELVTAAGADRVGMNFLLQEAVKAFEKGMREFFIAPVETIHHHKNRGGKVRRGVDSSLHSTRTSQAEGTVSTTHRPQAAAGDKKLEEELRQREVTAGGGSSGAPVGGSMAAAPIPSEQPQQQQQQQQEQQQPPPQLQEQQQQFQTSSAPPHGNEGAGVALQAPAEVRAATMPAGGNAMLFPLNSVCLPGGMLLSQGQQQTLPPQANAMYQQFLPALGGRGQGLAEMYFGTNQQMPLDEPTVTLSLREAHLLGQRPMNPAQQARGGKGGRNMNLEEYLFFINQNR
ncbi:hypothetical protein CYMTET_40411 [Cymbomonas tetramitiformis]|uniref:Uncharacterized protein n=1 Tax=Cymbomonas tetramitiformis TaxID=36881 RepID=A0AAE0F304_9CHLO|nr:hypothetical protein CYMTET_40411 [Cymbomonas tetramitiformis]